MHTNGYRPHASLPVALTTADSYASGRYVVEHLGMHEDLTPWQARWIGSRSVALGWRPDRARRIRAFYLGVARARSEQEARRALATYLVAGTY